MYISEHEHFTDFNATSALFWEQQDLVYGDWTSGENSDGCYEHFAELDIPQVGTASGFRLHGCWTSTQGASLNQLLGRQSGLRVPSLALPSVHTLLSTGNSPRSLGLVPLTSPGRWSWNWPPTCFQGCDLCFKPVKDQ